MSMVTGIIMMLSTVQNPVFMTILSTDNGLFMKPNSNLIIFTLLFPKKVLLTTSRFSGKYILLLQNIQTYVNMFKVRSATPKIKHAMLFLHSADAARKMTRQRRS